MTYERLREILNGRPSKKLARNTYVQRRNPRAIAVRLHQTDILTFYSDGRVSYDTGSWKTMVTKQRMNAYGPPGASIGSERGDWHVYLRKSRVFYFDGITLTKQGTVRTKDQAHARKLAAKARAARLDIARQQRARLKAERIGRAVQAWLSGLVAEEREACCAMGRFLFELGFAIVAPYIAFGYTMQNIGDGLREARETNAVPPYDAIEAWHFVHESNGVPVTMNGQIPVRKGQTLYVPAGAKMCHFGLHASRTPAQAHTYCNGPFLCRVLVWGVREEKHDKLVAQYRHVLSIQNVSDILSTASFSETFSERCKARFGVMG